MTRAFCNIAKSAWLPLLATAVLAATLVAQTEVRPATVEGVVKNLKTGEPLADVRVSVTPETGTTPRNANTDGEGKFTITGVPPGRYTISAARTLFYRPRRNTGTVTLTLASDQRLRDVQIFLAPTGVIAGRVADENRESLRSVRVEALRSEYRDGARTWVSSGQNTTDDRGEYRLFNLQPGTYVVRATPGNSLNRPSSSIFYPGVVGRADATPLQVEAGNEVGAIDIVMRRVPERSVQLKLGGVAAGSVATFSVQERNSGGQLQINFATLPDNTYRLNQLAPGAYDVLIQVSTAAPGQPRVLTHASKIPVNIGDSDENLGTIAVRPTIPVRGRIVVPEPLPSALDLRRLNVTLRALDFPTPIAFTARGNASPPGFNDDGTFTIPNVAAGRYQIQFSGLPPETFLISARAGGRDVLDSGFTVSGDDGPLELAIGGPGSVASVDGTVVNSKGETVPSSTVVLVPSADRRTNPGAFRVTSSDQFGNFSLRSVLPGDYRVLAWEDVEPGAYMDPAFLKDYETRGESVRVQRGSQNTVTARAIPGN